MNPNPDSQHFNPKEIAHLVGCPTSTIKREIKLGKLRAARINERVIIIYKPDFDSWMRTKFAEAATGAQLAHCRSSSAGKK